MLGGYALQYPRARVHCLLFIVFIIQIVVIPAFVVLGPPGSGKSTLLRHFELVTAMFAAENYNLREDWDKRKEHIHEQDVLKGMESTAFLTAVTLLSSYQRNQEDAAKPVI